MGLALAAACLVFVGGAARADRVDKLTGALLGDPSYRVKAQAAFILGRLRRRDPRAVSALIEALRDENASVRAVAAEALGKIGDPRAAAALRTLGGDPSSAVRAQARKALALVEREAPGGAARGRSAGRRTGKAPVLLVVSPFASTHASPEDARRLHDGVVRAAGELSGVTLDGTAGGARDAHGGTKGYFLDGNITDLKAGPPDAAGRVRIDCDVHFVVATWPEKAIRMMASVGGSLEGSTDPADIASAERDCLDDSARQVAEKLGAFLATRVAGRAFAARQR